MAYSAKLTFGDAKDYEVQSVSFSFNRSTDAKGKPSSPVYGGEIHLVVETRDENALAKMMLMQQHKAQSGTIEFQEASKEGVMKKITITDGFITSYSESAATNGPDSMTVAFTISARKIALGDATLTNTWPDYKD